MKRPPKRGTSTGDAKAELKPVERLDLRQEWAMYIEVVSFLRDNGDAVDFRNAGKFEKRWLAAEEAIFKVMPEARLEGIVTYTRVFPELLALNKLRDEAYRYVTSFQRRNRWPTTQAEFEAQDTNSPEAKAMEEKWQNRTKWVDPKAH